MSFPASTAARPAQPRQPVSRVGPNAVVQLGEALRELRGESDARLVYERAGFPELLDTPPEQMVDERVPARLFASLFANLTPEAAANVAARAGTLTGAYLLANRIPAPAQRLMQMLPAGLAARVLLRAIRAHSWTFAGSGILSARAGSPCVIEIDSNPLAMPDCVWHVAVFETLWRALVSPRAWVRHAHSGDEAAPLCRFEVGTGASHRSHA